MTDTLENVETDKVDMGDVIIREEFELEVAKLSEKKALGVVKILLKLIKTV